MKRLATYVFALVLAWISMACAQPGEVADMIVLDQNLFEIDADQIYGANVRQTILGGRVVYDRSEQGNEDTEDVDDLPRSLVR